MQRQLSARREHFAYFSSARDLNRQIWAEDVKGQMMYPELIHNGTTILFCPNIILFLNKLFLKLSFIAFEIILQMCMNTVSHPKVSVDLNGTVPVFVCCYYMWKLEFHKYSQIYSQH